MHIGTVLYGTYEYRTLQAPHLQFSTSTSTDQYNTMQYPYSTCTCPARSSAPSRPLSTRSSGRSIPSLTTHSASPAASLTASPVFRRTFKGARHYRYRRLSVDTHNGLPVRAKGCLLLACTFLWIIGSFAPESNTTRLTGMPSNVVASLLMSTTATGRQPSGHAMCLR